MIYHHAQIANDTIVQLDVDNNGFLFPKSQVVDYQMRGELLSNVSVFDFFTHTYDLRSTSASDSTEDGPISNTRSSNRGRPQHTRIFYLPSHPRAKTNCRVVRSDNHRHIPNFIGTWFPSSAGNTPIYYATMLMLLKPWRRLETDLKSSTESWYSAYTRFLRDNPSFKFLLSNIQYYHDARIIPDDVANAYPSGDFDHNPHDGDLSEPFVDDVNSLANAALINDPSNSKTLSDISSWREDLFAHSAVETARASNIFDSHSSPWTVDNTNRFSCATDHDLSNLNRWLDQMKMAIHDTASAQTPISSDAASDHSRDPVVEPLMDTATHSFNFVPALGPEQSLNTVSVDKLNVEQKRAYDIITWHLDQTLQNKDIPPLRMIIYGEGGTGKSVVIQTVTQAFAACGRPYLLLKASYTGIAASLIDGKTCHTLAQISISHRGVIGPEAKKKLHDMWQHARYLIIDEYSMLSRPFLATLSKNITLATLLSGFGMPDCSFGGINVILCGDLHQFPPVAVKNGDPLFQTINLVSQETDSALGRRIYEEFTTVVILREQKRTSNPGWCSFLRRLRHGQVEEADVRLLRSLIVDRDTNKKVDFNTDPWSSAPLITSRHRVRNLWNNIAVRKWCKRSGNQLLICKADDTIHGSQLSTIEREALRSKLKSGRRQQRKDLPEELEIAIGMQVMVTMNIETDLDIANGARGEIVDVVLDSREPPLPPDAIIHLSYQLSYILVKLNRTRAPRLDGLAEGVVPVQVASQSLKISLVNSEGKVVNKTISRKQYPITGAYAFTDYRAQGQTIPFVLVDIATPPSGRITLFNLYVALSRSRGPDNIRLLRDFKDDIIKLPHDPALLAEDDRLEKLDRSTTKWWARMQSCTCKLHC